MSKINQIKNTMQRFNKILCQAVFTLLLIGCLKIQAQGCVAIRHFSSCVGNSLENNLMVAGDIQLGVNYRYFKSFRHFRGTEEEPDRLANQTEVINHSHAWDFLLTYAITDRMYSSITFPTVINTRSSLYEHGRNERNTTYSRGLADIRLGVGFWLFDPAVHPNSNLALGVGLKLPTGDYNASDIFYNVGPEGSPQVRPVDQSIQPGDGGFGITIDFQYYLKIKEKLFGYAGGFLPDKSKGNQRHKDLQGKLESNSGKRGHYGGTRPVLA